MVMRCRQLLSIALLFSLILLVIPASSVERGEFRENKCIAMTVDMCKKFYNETHSSVSDSLPTLGVVLKTFMPLVHIKCSVNMAQFVCLSHAPTCSRQFGLAIWPCRKMCESVRRRCLPLVQKFGFDWPDAFNCSRFPTEDQGLCVPSDPEPNGEDVGSGGVGGGGGGDRRGENRWTRMRQVRPDCSHLRNSRQYKFVNQTGTCALTCSGSDMFTESDRQLAEVWMAVLAALCAISSLATILTFMIDRSRFRYPLRPVAFMALCYLCYSCSYFVRLLAGREATACDSDSTSGVKLLTVRGLDNTNCAIVFLLQYFFSTAAASWYVVLVLTWLLQVGWKWSPEAVAKRSCYFHLPAWMAPVALTVCVLIMRKVEADELFGMCNVGNQNSRTLLTFVIVPSIVFLLLPLLFLAAGFVAMSQVRRRVKLGGQKTNKFDILMGKIGLFSVLYLIPTGGVLGCNIYEYSGREFWHLPEGESSPSVAVFLIKTFASLAIGLTTVLWIWSCKTAESWRRFLRPSSRQSGVQYTKAACQLNPQEMKQQQQQLQQHYHLEQQQNAGPKLQPTTHYLVGSQDRRQQQQQQQQQRSQLGQSTFL